MVLCMNKHNGILLAKTLHLFPADVQNRYDRLILLLNEIQNENDRKKRLLKEM